MKIFCLVKEARHQRITCCMMLFICKVQNRVTVQGQGEIKGRKTAKEQRWGCSKFDLWWQLQDCKYTKNHWLVHLKWVNSTVYTLYLKKCIQNISMAKGTHCLKNVGLVMFHGSWYRSVTGPKFPPLEFSSWPWSPGPENRTLHPPLTKVCLVPWRVSMAPLMHISMGEFPCLGYLSSQTGTGSQLTQGNPRMYDQRQHFSFWDVALSRVQQKPSPTSWKQLLQGHFYEITSRLDF